MRDEALIIFPLLLRLTHYAINIVQVKEDTSATEKGSRFFQIVCNLACIEVIMSLEDKQLDDEILDNSELLVACYFIIESAVSYLSSQGCVRVKSCIHVPLLSHRTL